MKDKELNKKEAFALVFMVPYVDNDTVFLRETMWLFDNLNSKVERTSAELYASVAYIQEKIKELKEDSMILCHLKMDMNSALNHSEEILKNVSKSVSFLMEPTQLEDKVLGVFEVLVYASYGKGELGGTFFDKKEVDYLTSKLKVCFASLDSWGVCINSHNKEHQILDLKTQGNDGIYFLLRNKINSRMDRAQEFYANIEKERLDRTIDEVSGLNFKNKLVGTTDRQKVAPDLKTKKAIGL